MLRHNIEVLAEVHNHYSKLEDTNPKKQKLKGQILFLTTQIQKLIEKTKNELS